MRGGRVQLKFQLYRYSIDSFLPPFPVPPLSSPPPPPVPPLTHAHVWYIKLPMYLFFIWGLYLVVWGGQIHNSGHYRGGGGLVLDLPPSKLLRTAPMWTTGTLPFRGHEKKTVSILNRRYTYVRLQEARYWNTSDLGHLKTQNFVPGTLTSHYATLHYVAVHVSN